MNKNLLQFSILVFLFFISNFLNAQVYKDVAIVLRANCNTCHHEDGIGFSLTLYSRTVKQNIPYPRYFIIRVVKLFLPSNRNQ